MKSTKKKSIILHEDSSVTDLLNLIQRKQKSLIRLANSEMIVLFWLIGHKLTVHFDSAERIKIEKTTIPYLATRLVAKYGSFLSESNLKKMRIFVKLFPELSEVKEVAHFLNWEHVLLLLQIPDWNTRQIFLNDKINQGLTVKDLRAKISLRERSKISNLRKRGLIPPFNKIPKNRTRLLQIPLTYELLVRNDKSLKNVFKEPMLSSFRKITQPSNGLAKNKKKTIRDQVLKEIEEEIEKFRRFQNTWLNTHFNFLFWELGKYINERKLLKGKGANAIIRNMSLLLEGRYGKSFSQKQLFAAIKYAQQFQNPGIVSRIAHLISWEHILEILPLDEIEAVLFYCRLTANKGISVKVLRKQIAEGIYQQTPRAKEVEKALLYSLENPMRHTTIVKNRNWTEIGTSFNYRFDDINNSSPVQNIFKNSYFTDFIST